MDNLNYIFFEEFKRLDKLCGELYGDSRGITHYIDDMKSASQEICRSVPDWNADLKALIRLRHIRNHLAHTEGAFSEEACTQKDIDWIKNFYQRIMNQSDPLAVQHQRTQSKKQPSTQAYEYQSSRIHDTEHRMERQTSSQTDENSGTVYQILLAVLLAAGILYLLFLISNGM